MIFSKFIAGQLRKPNGLFGKYILTYALNKSNKLMNERVLHLLQVEDNDRILEIGFGGGYLLEKICQSAISEKVTGVDFSNDIVDAGKNRLAQYIKSGELDLVCADVNQLTFKANSFNKICTVNTIYFWSNVTRILKELIITLDSKGLIFICFSTEEAMEDFHKVTQHGFNVFTVEQVKQFMDAAGFINIRIVPGENQHGKFVVAVGEKF